MKIRIFVLGTESSGANKLFDGMLRKTFAEQLSEDGAIEYYASVKDATSSIGSAFSDAQTVLFFAATEYYCALKKIISRAFRLHLVRDDEVLEKAKRFAQDKMKAEGQFEETHAYFPANSKQFIADDGLFSGFACVKGEQSIIFLPYSVDRACDLLSAQVIPFINSTYEQTIPTAFAEHIYASRLQELLEEEPVSVALALTKTADLFCDYISSSELLKKCITKTPKSEERGTMQPSEYVVNLSIAAAELQGVPYGIVLSNAYYMDENSKDRLTVFMAVTNDKQTTVREVKSFSWESSSDFMKRCCAELCKLLSDIIQKDRGTYEEGTAADSKNIQKYRTLIAIVGAAIILLIIAGGYIFTSNSYSMQDWLRSHFPAVFSEQTLPENEARSLPDETGSAANGELQQETTAHSGAPASEKTDEDDTAEDEKVSEKETEEFAVFG